MHSECTDLGQVFDSLGLFHAKSGWDVGLRFLQLSQELGADGKEVTTSQGSYLTGVPASHKRTMYNPMTLRDFVSCIVESSKMLKLDFAKTWQNPTNPIHPHISKNFFKGSFMTDRLKFKAVGAVKSNLF